VASLDKTSVKDEVGRLKADFDRLGAEGKISSYCQIWCIENQAAACF
jgi:hypothetical protein